MKKFFGLLIVAIAMTACSSDDDSSLMASSLEGTWKMTAFTSENPHDLNGDGTASRNIMAETNCYQNELMNFNADGTGRITSNSYAEISLDLVIGSTTEYEYSIECVAETEITACTYVQNGDQVSLTFQGFTVTATLSNNTLTYVVPEGFFIEVEDPNSGTVITLEDMTFVYTKQ